MEEARVLCDIRTSIIIVTKVRLRLLVQSIKSILRAVSELDEIIVDDIYFIQKQVSLR